MKFVLHQIFEGAYPPEAAQYCNENGYIIKEMDRVDGKRRFQIQEAPGLSADEISAAKRQEVMGALDALDAKSVRPARAVALAVANGNPPSAVDVARLADIEAEAQKLRKDLAAL